MVFDGTRALTVGDYVTVDGELGPWTAIVEVLGIEPRSTFMKTFFLVYGAGWFAVTACFVADLRWARAAMLVAAIGSLWYLVIGTISSALQIVLLVFLRTRNRI